MYWFRSNLRLGSGLALVALAVQITLSLVHAHFGGVGKTLAGPIVAVQLDGAPSQPAPAANTR